jgi:hypothetical protein
MIRLSTLDEYRVQGNPYNCGDIGGAFMIPFPPPEDNILRVIASVGKGWDHVSVSLPNRIPTWYEMEFIKRKFFLPHETAMQLHVPEREHINIHPHTLHLWRPLKGIHIPVPPKELV